MNTAPLTADEIRSEIAVLYRIMHDWSQEHRLDCETEKDLLDRIADYKDDLGLLELEMG